MKNVSSHSIFYQFCWLSIKSFASMDEMSCHIGLCFGQGSFVKIKDIYTSIGIFYELYYTCCVKHFDSLLI